MICFFGVTWNDDRIVFFFICCRRCCYFGNICRPSLTTTHMYEPTPSNVSRGMERDGQQQHRDVHGRRSVCVWMGVPVLSALITPPFPAGKRHLFVCFQKLSVESGR